MNTYIVDMEIIHPVFPMIQLNLWMLVVRSIRFVRTSIFDFSRFEVFVYNYAMEDFGTVKVETVLDIMKVMSFAMKQGKVRIRSFLSSDQCV